MQVEVSEIEGVPVVRIDGDIRTEDAARLGETMEGLLDDGDLDLVLDMEKVAFVTSAALGQIASVAVVLRRRGGNLAVCGLNPDVRKVFQITRIDKLVEIQTSVEAAREALRRLVAPAT